VWRQSQKTDAANTMTFTRFTLVGKFTQPQAAGTNPPTLALDCIPASLSHNAKGKFLAANLLVGTTLKIVYVEPEEIRGTSYFPKVVVQYRADGAKGEEEKWSASTDKTSLSVPKDSLKKILRAHTVAITADNDQGAPVGMSFDLPASPLAEDGCNVDEHAE